MKEVEEPKKKKGKAKKFFVLAILTAIGTVIATIFMKKKKDQIEDEE